MTISSVLVGLAPNDQRQIQSSLNPDPAAPDAALALKAGAWSAIDWEFSSVLRALLPDAKDEVLVPGIGGEKADSPEASTAPFTTPPTTASLSDARPVAFSIDLESAVNPSQKESSETARVQPFLVQMPGGVRVVPRFTLPPDARIDPKSGPDFTKKKAAEAETVQPVAVQVPEAAPEALPNALLLGDLAESLRENLSSSTAPVKENLPEAKVVRTAPAPIADSEPRIQFKSLPLDVRMESKLDVPKPNTKPEAVQTNAAPDGASTPRPSALPLDIRIESQPEDPKTSVKSETVQTNEAPISAGAQTLRSAAAPDAPKSDIKSEVVQANGAPARDAASTPRSKHFPFDSSFDSRPDAPAGSAKLVKENAPEAPLVQTQATAQPSGAEKPSPTDFPLDIRVNSRQNAPKSSSDLVKESLPLAPLSNVVAKASPGLRAKSEPDGAASAGQITAKTPAVQTPPVPAPSVSTVVRLDADPVKDISPSAEPPIPAIRVSDNAPSTTEQRDKNIDGDPARPEGHESSAPLPAPATTVAADRLPPADLADSKAVKEKSSPVGSPDPIVQVLQSAAASTTSPSPTNPEKRPDDRLKSHPAGSIAVQEPKPTPASTNDSPDLPALAGNRKTADLDRFSIPEPKSKGDQLSANDSEVAFTGRLIPRKPAEESLPRPEAFRPIERPTQPDSVEARLEKLSGAATRETQEAPVDRQVRPAVEVEHARTEPAVVFSTVHRDTAPASASRPGEPVPAPRTASSEIMQPPVNREAPGPVREISMRFNDQAQESAHLRVVEKGGEVLVSVRSGSEQLARTLSSDLGELTHRLEQTGFQAELYRPAAQSSSGETGHDRRDSQSNAGQNPNQSWARERRDSQEHHGQKPHEWADDFEESMGLS